MNDVAEKINDIAKGLYELNISIIENRLMGKMDEKDWLSIYANADSIIKGGENLKKIASKRLNW